MTTPLSSRIEAFLKLESESTPGTWSRDHKSSFPPFGVDSDKDPADWVVSPDDDYERPNKADADFIVAAKNEAPDIIRHLQAQIEVAKEALKTLLAPLAIHAQDCGCEPETANEPEFLCGNHKSLHLCEDALSRIETIERGEK